jgi:penicillin-binding protein 1C
VKLRSVKYGFVGVLFTVMVWWWFCLPDPLFDASYSTVLLDKNNELLGARLAADGQWRFPGDELVIPQTFREAIIQFEDKRFYAHNGVDIIALCRALRDNILSGKVTSGGSTLTMQTMRLSRCNRPRTIFQKCIEMLWACRAEMKYSKDKILQQYASHAPFGGNVVGLGAASWRYFQKTPEQLSWGEAATLAVLPNAPGLIHPGRNRDLLMQKRNALIAKLQAKRIINNEDASLAMQEPLPDQPYPLPDIAPHLLGHYNSTGAILHSTIDIDLQQRLSELVNRHADILSMNGVHNAALLLMETETGNVLAYIGNTQHESRQHQNDVDIIRSERSSGSILKPFLHCAALEEGLITPAGILEDIPTFIRGYQPLNFSQEYMGMVPANEALSMSLNVPAVRLLQDYGILPFKERLVAAGITTLHYSPDHYVLPLVLGGAEVTLWDVCGAYASMGRILNHTYKYDHQYSKEDIHPPVILAQKHDESRYVKLTEQPPLWNAGAIWHTFEAMSDLRRPDSEGQWETFRSSKRVAWKTGTSFGYRDAWAVGVTPKYTIGVWVGNADG